MSPLSRERVPELMDLPALVLSFAFAIGSYYIVELPFLRRKKRVRSAKEADRPAQTKPPAERQAA